MTSVTVKWKEGGSISLDPIQRTTKLVPTIRNGKWKITAKITAVGTIVQNGSNLDIMSLKMGRELEKN